MHTDVGGGYKDQSLAGIPLVWMTEMAVNHGMYIYSRYEKIVNKKSMIKENENAEMHDSRGGRFGWMYRRKPRAWDRNRVDKPVIHQSVLARTRNQSNEDSPEYNPWIKSLDHEVEPWIKYEDQNWLLEVENE